MFGSSAMTDERDQPADYRRWRYLALTSGRAVTLFVRVDELV